MLATGNALFTENCMICHSNQPRAPLPDLRRMAPNIHAGFEQIVLQGLFVPQRDAQLCRPAECGAGAYDSGLPDLGAGTAA